MSRLILFITVFILSLSAWTQEVIVSGRCIDKRGKPLELVSVFVSTDSSDVHYTDADGQYKLKLTTGKQEKIVFKLNEFRVERFVRVGNEPSQRLADVKFDFVSIQEIAVEARRQDPFEIPKLPKIDAQNIPMGSYERVLVYTTAAVSNNELTSNYNVRGGSYDENLVYVNGFQIYRPFLTRSGQQEGMSFINSALVESVSFSAGGFDAQYGDRLSSVLDISYRRPNSFHGSVMASALGVESHIEHAPSSRFNFLAGARYRANGYLLNALPAKGAYNPVFWDAQLLTNYALTEKVTWSLIGHFSSNDYRFAPETQRTDFGTANEAYSFMIYFDGQEKSRFQTMMGGTSLKWIPNKRTNLDFYATAFNTDEREYFDIQGQYYINELEKDPSKENYGDSIDVLGIGTFLNHSRNRLNATILNAYHTGRYQWKNGYRNESNTTFLNHAFLWGANLQRDQFSDTLSEWRMIDSAGYSQPQASPNEVELYETIKGRLELTGYRISGYVQVNASWSDIKRNYAVTVSEKKGLIRRKTTATLTDTIRESNSKWAFAAGIRGGYISVNDEYFVTPRISVTYFPRVYMYDNGRVTRRDVRWRLASGLYYQPPFYREFRTFEGQLNLNVRSQKSFHVITGTDVYFNMWGREVPFKFSAEAYFKYLWDVNPYEIDNVRTRYFANNDAVAYAYGLDLNLHGQFVEGIESFFKMGLMSTREDVLTDEYKIYYNAAGERIIFGYSEDQTVVDSAAIQPGFIPRPTDQLVNFGALVQDQMPGYESFSVQMGLQFGSRLPYGPPDHSRYKDTLRMKSYFRVDLGMSYDFLYKKRSKSTFWSKNFTDAILSFEVFNLLGINNVLSKQWVQDVEGRYYSVPNYLTQRRFNLKLIVRF
ncbi:MAG: hypothetical protein RIT43_150 [Bacteroidota bacterium]|jgi:hypothetical protein